MKWEKFRLEDLCKKVQSGGTPSGKYHFSFRLELCNGEKVAVELSKRLVKLNIKFSYKTFDFYG